MVTCPKGHPSPGVGYRHGGRQSPSLSDASSGDVIAGRLDRNFPCLPSWQYGGRPSQYALTTHSCLPVLRMSSGRQALVSTELAICGSAVHSAATASRDDRFDAGHGSTGTPVSTELTIRGSAVTVTGERRQDCPRLPGCRPVRYSRVYLAYDTGVGFPRRGDSFTR